MAKLDIGPPDYRENLHPVIKENYGQWKYHEKVKPGVLKHVAQSGAELYTIRVGSPRLVSVDYIRDICALADQYVMATCALPAVITLNSLLVMLPK